MVGLRIRRSNGTQVSGFVFRGIQKADRARDNRDWEHAIARYRRVVASAPALSHIWMQLANCAGEAQRWDEALDAYSRAKELDKANLEPALFSARIHLRRGDLNAAIICYKEVLAVCPDNEEAQEQLKKSDDGRHDTVGVSDLGKAKYHPALPANVTIAEMQAKLDSLYFHHSMNFGDGLVSKALASVEFVERTADSLYGSLDLTGRSLLDVGTWTGAYAFEAKRRGAARVLATDHYVWNNPVFKGREAFNTAHALTGLDLEVRDIDAPDISVASVGLFDVVLFAGVFYHLIDPISVTRQISTCAEHLLIVETHLDELDNPNPAMRFYPGSTLNNDGSNWWGPNPSCVYELLKEFGFSDIFYCSAPMITQRGIFHAFRDTASRELLGWQSHGRWQSLNDAQARAQLFAAVKS